MTRLLQLGLLAACCILLTGDLHAAYGVKFTPGDKAAAASAYLVSENAFELRMRQPDGQIRHFRRDFENPAMLIGEQPPWVGEDKGNGIFTILTHPEFKGGRTGFVFEHGHLRRLILGRREYQFKEVLPFPSSTNSVESLWPKELSEDEVHALYKTWTDGDGRLRLWFNNPNKAGCLCAELVLFGLALVLLAGRRWYALVPGLAFAAAAFFLLAKTGSRGALLSCAAGMGCIGLFRLRALLSWKRMLVVLGGLLVLGGVVFGSGMGTRFTKGLVETKGKSESLRINVWREFPRMVVDSPTGWGLGTSGRAYISWYQNLDNFKSESFAEDFKVVRTLVNSHFTWLAEFNWPLRVLYLLLLFGGLAMLTALARAGKSPVPLALWSAFCVSGFFNSVMEDVSLWALPLLSLALLWKGPTLARRRLWVPAVCGFGLSVAAIATIVVLGCRAQVGPKICGSGDRVIVNGTSARTWVVDDGVVLGRGFLGSELRMFYGAFPEERPLGFVWKLDKLPSGVEHLVLAGKSGTDFVEAFKGNERIADGYKSITFLSPPFAASSLPPALRTRPGMRVVQGDLLVRLTPDRDAPPAWLKVVPGAEIYLTGWMQLALQAEKDSDSSK